MQERQANRIFYLSIPPSIFTSVAGCVSEAASSENGWTRVIVEKPFGKDSESFNELSTELYRHLTEDQILPVLRDLLPVLLSILGAPEVCFIPISHSNS